MDEREKKELEEAVRMGRYWVVEAYLRSARDSYELREMRDIIREHASPYEYEYLPGDRFRYDGVVVDVITSDVRRGDENEEGGGEDD